MLLDSECLGYWIIHVVYEGILCIVNILNVCIEDELIMRKSLKYFFGLYFKGAA